MTGDDINVNQDIPFTEYTYDKTAFTYTTTTTTTKNYFRTNKFKIAHELARKIKEYNHLYIIILVS